MKYNNLEAFRKKLREHKLCKGMIITMTDPVVSEIAGEIGCDFTWIDAEHNLLDPETIMHHIRAVRGSDCAPLVRVPWNEWGIIKPILDAAPAGVIIPMINTADEAAEAVSCCKYPPFGKRGFGIKRCSCYGSIPFSDYLEAAQTDPMVILQIEHISVLKELDRILQIPGIDSICIGPADLSGSMGKPCAYDDPEIKQVLDEIAYKVKKAGLYLGTAESLTAAWRQRQIDWIANMSDCGALLTGARAELEA